MAIKSDFKFKGLIIKDAYIKITHVGMIDRKHNDVKVYLATATFEVKAGADTEPICNDMIHFIGDTGILHHEQAYDELKKAFPASINI